MLTIAGGIILAIIIIVTAELWLPLVWWLMKAAFVIFLIVALITIIAGFGE